MEEYNRLWSKFDRIYALHQDHKEFEERINLPHEERLSTALRRFTVEMWLLLKLQDIDDELPDEMISGDGDVATSEVAAAKLEAAVETARYGGELLEDDVSGVRSYASASSASVYDASVGKLHAAIESLKASVSSDFTNKDVAGEDEHPAALSKTLVCVDGGASSMMMAATSVVINNFRVVFRTDNGGQNSVSQHLTSHPPPPLIDDILVWIFVPLRHHGNTPNSFRKLVVLENAFGVNSATGFTNVGMPNFNHFCEFYAF